MHPRFIFTYSAHRGIFSFEALFFIDDFDLGGSCGHILITTCLRLEEVFGSMTSYTSLRLQYCRRKFHCVRALLYSDLRKGVIAPLDRLGNARPFL